MISELLITSTLNNNLGPILESIFIFEGRIDLLKKQHEKGIDSSHDSLAKHREPHDIIDHFASNADPSKNKKHTQQILSWYKDKQFRQEDVGRVRQVLKDFESHGKKLPKVPHPRKQGLELPGHDISSYGSFHGLNKALEPFRTSQSNTFDWGEFSKGDLDHLNGKGSTVVHDDPKYTVREVHDQRAMDVLGRGADWCVVSNKHRKTKVPGSNDSSSLFDHYMDRHPGSSYYHVHDKETGERFAAHPASGQHLFDVDDREQGHNPEIASKYREGMSKALKGLSTRARVKIKSPFIDHSQEDLHAVHTDEDPTIRLAVAKHPNTRSDTLHALHTDDDRGVRAGVASNQNTHTDTLHALHTDSYANTAVAENPNTRHDTLHALHTSRQWSVKYGVARHPNTRSDTLHALHTDNNWEIKRGVAENPNTRHDTLHALHTDKSGGVRESVARNPNTRHDTLHAMHTDYDKDVRASVASNPNVHHDILHTLHTDDDEVVRAGVASNPNTHHDILHTLHTDEKTRVRDSVARNPSAHHDILHTLHTDDDRDVRAGVAFNPSAHHDILHTLHTDESGWVRENVAKNPSAHHDILHTLHTDGNWAVRASVAKNPNTHHDILHTLSTDDDEVVRDGAKEALKKRGLL